MNVDRDKRERIPTPRETGGAGSRYECHVGAYFLARLLTGGATPILVDSQVDEVRFQTRRLGWETDDLLVLCSSSEAGQRKMAIQAKRSFVLRASDSECVKTFQSFWNDFNNSEIFEPGSDSLVLATLPSSERLRVGLRDLLECARNSSDEVDFAARISPGGITSEPVREYSQTIRSIIKSTSPTGPTDSEFWRFLRSMYLLNLDLATDTSQDEASTKSILASSLADPSNRDAVKETWLELLEIASKSDATGRNVRLSDLPDVMRSEYDASESHDEHRERLCELNLTYRSGNRALDINGWVIERDEVSQILETFHDSLHNAVLVSGKSGVGKTSVTSQVLERIESAGWPMLLLRVDRLPLSSTPTELGQELGLSKSPVMALADIAGGSDCLLVIDQLDALSLASRRHPNFFDCIAALLSQARTYPNMKVLLACRQFDIEDNRRFGELISGKTKPREFSLNPFDASTVRKLVERLGIAADDLNPSQLELLSLPIHLKLLAYVVTRGAVTTLGFQTEKELYDLFWREKRMSMRSRIDDSQVRAAVELVVRLMSEHESLFIHEAMLNKYDDEVTLLVSENILVKDGPRISFFHDSFFDYMFAQWFISEELDLASYILEQDQSLFMRSQVTQVLLHQRELPGQDFVRSLDAILSNEAIRTHLKIMVLSFLSSVSEPTEREWKIVEPLLDTELSNRVWSLMRGSVDWFDLLYSRKVLQGWLSGDNERLRNGTVAVLQAIQKQRPDQTAALLRPYLGESDSWDVRLANVVSLSALGATREFFDFVCEVVGSGVFDQALIPSSSSVDFWFHIEDLVKQKPEWACELIAYCFERLAEMATQEEYADLFLKTGYPVGRDVQVMADAARATPERFVESLMPHLMALIRISQDEVGDPQLRELFWHYPTARGKHQLDADLISAIGIAMSGLAKENPRAFLGHAEKLRRSEFSVIQGILAKAYTANGELLADEAVEYLLEDSSRFASGTGDEKYRVARLLIEAISPHCSSQNYVRLEDAILDYYPDYEMKSYGEEHKGYAQGVLLEGVDSDRHSVRATERLLELRTRFGEELSREPREPQTGGFVGSPISEQDARGMSDDDWLIAIEKYSSNSPSDDLDNFLVGGARELSRLLETLVKEDPSRFAKLAQRMPDGANPAYFEAILQGIEGADIDLETVVDTCLRCHNIPGRPLGRWITQPLAGVTESPLPDEALSMIAWYATNDPDPDPQSSSDEAYLQFGREHTRYDPVFYGMNSVRGAASLSASRLIHRDERHKEFFEPYLSKMANDPSDAVRACVAEVLVGVLRYDQELAVELFAQLSDTDERLLATAYSERFLQFASSTHFRQLEPIFSQMLFSNDEDVAEAGARWVCYASLTVEEAHPLAERCATGSKALRMGAVGVYSANLRNEEFRSVCEKMLARFFEDPEVDIRRAAARCFYGFKGRELQDYERFVKQYIDTQAFEPARNPLIYALDETDATMDDVTALACERVLDLAGERAGDVTTAVAGTSDIMAKLIGRVYEETTDQSMKTRCLDIIDKMAWHGAYGLDEFMAKHSRGPN